ncbi:hypothetical protein K501DRAFT_257622 [Backusella circina FSU 941]|nr:hypothetical protein K501DRAFT_257622 [Backusella circina FSU 941]
MKLSTPPLTPPPEKSDNSLELLKDEYKEYAPKSRHGHGQDVTNEDNVRQVAGCIPIDVKNQRILLISSRKNKNTWVVPKGGWEKDETQKHAAQRETWEEAGIKGTIVQHLGVFEERTAKKNLLKAHHWIYEMHIIELAKKFPEKKKRERRWFSYEEALAATREHPYIQEAIKKSSLHNTVLSSSTYIDRKSGTSKAKYSFLSYIKSYFI